MGSSAGGGEEGGGVSDVVCVLCVIRMSCCVSREHEGADLSSIPAGVFLAALQRAQLAETGLVDEAFLLALPQEVLILFGQRAQVHVLAGVLVDDVFGVDFHCLAVGEEAGPEGGPVGVEDLFLGHVCAA